MADGQDFVPELGDIVLLNQGDGTWIPAIITKVVDATTVLLDMFGPGGMGGSTVPFIRGDQAGQWQPKPAKQGQAQ